ncbi:hypothetical protein [Coralloluteibacterium thermophilus]|uniref:TonB C-terminal domain-containing protein n=1 Tax=Coralloluteibacterium thermophilum TaxID=2707049 RepID=A0ABV9NL62_9GAMM
MSPSGWVFAACIAMLSIALPAGALESEVEDDAPQLWVLLDPSLDGPTRTAELARFMEKAVEGVTHAQYVVGTLYRLGMRHPARLVERDDAEAARYLSNAAVAGHLGAMAGMAELKLRSREYLEALLWAHAYAHYETLRAELRGEDPGSQAMAASMIQRAQSGVDADEFERYFHVFLSTHDGRIRQALERESDEEEPDGGLEYVSARSRSVFVNELVPPRQQMYLPGAALFLLEVGPDGRVTRHLAVDSLPDENYAARLAQLVRSTRFNPDPGTERRTALMPFSYDDRTIRIRRD